MDHWAIDLLSYWRVWLWSCNHAHRWSRGSSKETSPPKRLCCGRQVSDTVFHFSTTKQWRSDQDCQLLNAFDYHKYRALWRREEKEKVRLPPVIFSKRCLLTPMALSNSYPHHKDRVRAKISSMYLLLAHLVFFTSRLIAGAEPSLPANDLELTFGHLWDRLTDRVTIYFDVSNTTVDGYRYYYFDLHPFASLNQPESFPRQSLTDAHNSLIIAGLHENDYVSCVSFVDSYANVFKPRYGCYEFTLGEKIIGSHHAASSGYLSPLLVAVVFVLHTFIAVVHHIKAKNYAQKLLHRFIDVSPKSSKRIVQVRKSLKELDQTRPSFSIQRRLSRVSIDGPTTDALTVTHSKKSNEHAPIYTLTRPLKGRPSIATLQSIPEHNV